MARNALDVRMQFPTDAELKKMFDAVPLLKKHDVQASTARAGGNVILKRARQLAPRSTAADRAKRSAKQKAAANWDYPLHKAIAMVVRKYPHNSTSVIGPKHPEGNKAWFNSPKSGSRRHILWGRDAGRIKKAIRNWIVQAFGETQLQQLFAMKQSLRKKIHEMLA